MIKDLISGALGEQGAELLSGLGLSGDKQNQAMDLAKDSVLDGLKGSLTSGNIGDITKAFSGGASSGLVQNIIKNYGGQLISKLGLSESMANTVSTTLIPMIFSFIDKKEDAPSGNDEGVAGMLGDLLGGDSGGGVAGALGGLLKGKFKF